MRVLFISIVGSVHDKNTWSGTTHYLYKHLSQHYETENLSTLKTKKAPFKFAYRIASKFSSKTFLFDTSHFLAKLYAREIEQYLKSTKDLGLIVSDSSIPMAYLRTNIKTMVYTDSNFNAMLAAHHEFQNLSRLSINRGNDLEERALNNIDYVVYSSEWAKRTAVEAYGINESKIHVNPFGLNLDEIQDIDKVRSAIEDRWRTPAIDLIFIGRNWERKGGDIAYKTMLNLRKNHNFDSWKL
tara:strand:- start:23 stop:745 length:723 start_codon:yes stop_codon:yes gene_type:complete